MRRVWHYRWLVVGALCSVSSVASAAQEKAFAAPQAAGSVPAASAGGLLQVTLSLALVLGAIFAAAWLMRRLRGFSRSSDRSLEVIAQVALGAKERAVLLQVGKQQVLIGIAPGQVTALHVLAENIERAEAQVVAKQGHDQGPAAIDFKQILKRSIGLP